MLPRRQQAIPPDVLAHITALMQDDAEYQADLQQQRDYYVGRQFVALTDRLRMFLGGNVGITTKDFKRVRLNIFRTVINAVVERLIVSKIVTDEQGVEEPLKDELGKVVKDADGKPQAGVVKPTANWAGRTWLHNRMDARQRKIYEMTLRDSEAFVLVAWDDEQKVARFTLHPRYIDESVLGNRTDQPLYGCMAVYQNNDPEQPLLFVTKRWTETAYDTGTRADRQRMTIYYPDKIEKYAGMGQTWEAVQDRGDPAWPLPWIDPATKEPLGIPIVHFRSTAGFEAGEAVGPQNAINKTMIDLLAAADLTAFQILIALGWNPVDADGNPLPIEPGTWIGTMKTDAKAQVIPGADLTNISEQVYNWLAWAAMSTDTPVSRFTMSRHIAAEGTLKEQSAPLLNKARMRQSELAIGIADLFVIARKLHNAFFSAPKLDPEVEISVTWEPLEARDESAELERATQKLALGIPQKKIWAELGYSEAEIAQWTAEAEQRKQEQMKQMQELAAKQSGQEEDKAQSNGVPFGGR